MCCLLSLSKFISIFTVSFTEALMYECLMSNDASVVYVVYVFDFIYKVFVIFIGCFLLIVGLRKPRHCIINIIKILLI